MFPWAQNPSTTSWPYTLTIDNHSDCMTVFVWCRYIHSMHLCHLDLKPGNIFLTDNELFSGERRAGSRLAEDDSSVVSSDDGFDEDLAEEDDEIIYKIGQLIAGSVVHSRGVQRRT